MKSGCLWDKMITWNDIISHAIGVFSYIILAKAIKAGPMCFYLCFLNIHKQNNFDLSTYMVENCRSSQLVVIMPSLEEGVIGSVTLGYTWKKKLSMTKGHLYLHIVKVAQRCQLAASRLIRIIVLFLLPITTSACIVIMSR